MPFLSLIYWLFISLYCNSLSVIIITTIIIIIIIIIINDDDDDDDNNNNYSNVITVL